MMSLIKIIFLSMVIVLFNKPSVYTEIRSNIVAKIGNGIITNLDIENKIKTNLFLASDEINQLNVDKIKGFALKSLVNLKLKENEIKKYNLKINNKAIDQHITNIANNLKINKTELKNQFNFYNLNYNQFLQDINTEFLWQSLIAKIYIDRIQINDEQISLEINQIIKNKKNTTEFNLAEIEIFYENSDDLNTLYDKIDSSIKTIGFEKTAIKLSTSPTAMSGGYLGWISLNQLSPEIAKILQSLNNGQVSPPIKKANTLTLLKLIEKRNSVIEKELDINRLRSSLENNKKNELLNLYSNSHLSKIRNTTLIEFK